MARCPDCLTEISSDVSRCPSCGHSFDDATQRFDSRSTTSFDSIDDARFVPGTILADRYRIVGLVGKGGMGEVYRADDLKLGQPVALKFLPDELLRDGAALARFHREVRVARQVSHKNVCRVYDIAEFNGRHFLSMEFIKGEELSSLLRRIGRFPQDKAIQIARQICAGLAAAHDNSVLHRDLKPANVMIDEHGNARITDFGLAGLEEELRADEGMAGTPAYMAPEQFDKQPATVRSDIYSLGLVLYELFTGKKAFEATTLNELLSLRRSDHSPTNPTVLVKELDPIIEKVIDRCLKKDPTLRPTSALQVAAALPGGDPLAAALAAGETPSPEMVAAAPKQGALKLPIAAALLAGFVAVLILVFWLTRYTAVYRMTPVDQSPEVLRAHARNIIKEFGYTQPELDSVDGFLLKTEYLSYISANDQSPNRWDRLQTDGPGAYRYWYRGSPRYFETIEDIDPHHPGLDVSGMTLVYLGTTGRLHWFEGVPPQREPAATAPATPDWSIAFREADLDIAQFTPSVSQTVPLHAYDTRMAWDGVDSSNPNLKTHIEAASFRGKITYFETVYPWDQRLRQDLPPDSRSYRLLTFLVITVVLITLIGGALLARHNLRLGRGDRRGAARFAWVIFTFQMLVWLFYEHHNWVLAREFDLFIRRLSEAIFLAVFFRLLYLALEPFVRRRWPQRIIGWSRLLAGDYRDPLVGRDILIGALFGAVMILATVMAFAGLKWIGVPPQLPMFPGVTDIGLIFMLRVASQFQAGASSTLISMFLLLLFVVVLRKEWLAWIALWLLLGLLNTLVVQAQPIMIPFTALCSGLAVFVLYRFGLLAAMSAYVTYHLMVFYPMTTEVGAWYARDFLAGAAITIALGVFGFYFSLGGQKLIPSQDVT